MSKFKFLSGHTIVQRAPYAPPGEGRFIPVVHKDGRCWGIYDLLTDKVHKTKVRMRGHRAMSTLKHWPELMRDHVWEDADQRDWRADDESTAKIVDLRSSEEMGHG